MADREMADVVDIFSVLEVGCKDLDEEFNHSDCSDCSSRCKSDSDTVRPSRLSMKTDGLLESPNGTDNVPLVKRSSSMPAGYRYLMSDGLPRLIHGSPVSTLSDEELEEWDTHPARPVTPEPYLLNLPVNHIIKIVVTGHWRGKRLPRPGEEEFVGMVDFITEAAVNAKGLCEQLDKNIDKLGDGLRTYIQTVLEQRITPNGVFSLDNA